MTNLFLEGGGWMYGVLAVGLLNLGLMVATVVLLIGSFRRKKPRRGASLVVGGVQIFLSAVTLGLGAIGYWYNLNLMEGALHMASPENQARLRAAGEAAATYPLYLAVVLSVLPVLAGVTLFLRGLRTSRTDRRITPSGESA